MRLKSAVVITLLRRRDRLDAFKTRWEQTGSPLLVRVCWATEGGAAGQYASHLKALESAGDGPVLVLEDDAMFADDFARRLRTLPAPEAWDLLYLGGDLGRRPQRVHLVATGSTPVQFCTRTHAYIARDPAQVAAVLRRHLDRGFRLDDAMADPELRKHALLPFPVGQAGGLGGDIGDQDREDDQFWQPMGLG